MITREVFKEVMESFMEQCEIDDGVSKALEELCGGWVLFNTENRVYYSFMKLLRTVMHDDADWIQWWIYDTKYGSENCGVYDENGELMFDVKTLDGLYDFLVHNYEKSQSEE